MTARCLSYQHDGLDPLMLAFVAVLHAHHHQQTAFISGEQKTKKQKKTNC